MSRQNPDHISYSQSGTGSSLIPLGFIDDYRLFVSPVLLGGGPPYFPALDARIKLLKTQTFGSRGVYLRCTAPDNKRARSIGG